MIRQAISCDICGNEKRQTNHWFVAFEQAGELRLGGWTSRNRSRPNSKHLCGQTCVHKLVDEYMAQIVASKPLRALDESATLNETQDTQDPIEYHELPVAAKPAASARPARREPSPAPRIIDRDNEAVERLSARSESRHLRNRFADDTDSRSVNTEYDFNLDDECSARLIPTPDPAPAAARHRPAVEAQPAAPTRTPLVAANKSTIDRSVIELPLGDEPPSFSSRKWRSEAWERERARELRAANDTPAGIASRLRLN